MRRRRNKGKSDGRGGKGQEEEEEKKKKPAKVVDQLDKFLLLLKNQKQTLRRNQLQQWRNCWHHADELAAASLRILLVSLAKLPFSADFPPPPIQQCRLALRRGLLRQGKEHVEVQVEVTLDVLNRLLQFEWDTPVAEVKQSVEETLVDATQRLDPRQQPHRRLQARINQMLEELDKAWTIKSRQSDAAEEANNEQDEDGICQWQTATVGWLCQAKTFLPPELPIMKTPKGKFRGVYESVEEYFDIITRLWVALTFGEGYNALSPMCKIPGSGGKLCGHVLWPVTSGDLQCRTRNCDEEISFACCNRFHKYALCFTCYKATQKKFCGPPGPSASTHVYDGSISRVNYDGVVYISNVCSRRPPENQIHWKTTRRLSSANLVGIIKLTATGAALQQADRIYWAEIELHSKSSPREEYKLREKQKLAIKLLFLDSNHEDMFRLSVHERVAIIDCQTFVPEYIPVLKAMEIQRKSSLPFSNGDLLNLSATRAILSSPVTIKESFTKEDFDSMAGGKFSQKGEENQVVELVSEMVDASQLEPLCQLRRDERARESLVLELSELVKRSTLDSGQLNSFLASLTYQVHCTQGPPGTGKSYLGVVITQALLLIRKYWIRKCPSVGAPPILVLSYKNHAIDEFLKDLVKQTNHLNLIRIGGYCSDLSLQHYQERQFLSSNKRVVECQNKLRLIHSLQLQNLHAQGEYTKIDYSRLDYNLNDEKLSKQDKKQNEFEAATLYKSILERLKVVMSIVFNKEECSWKKEFTMMTSEAVRLLAMLKLNDIDTILQTSTSHVRKDDFSLLYEGIAHYSDNYEICEVLWKWMQGFKPSPRCAYVVDKDQCKGMCELNLACCIKHRCKGYEEDNKRCCNTVAVMKNCCEHHFCAIFDCQYPKIDGQKYCEFHACFICMKYGKEAKLALDEAPRNTCDIHLLCCSFDDSGNSCQNEAGHNSFYCDHHKQIQCMGLTKKKRQCRARVISSKAYCAAHINQAPKSIKNATIAEVKNIMVKEVKPIEQKNEVKNKIVEEVDDCMQKIAENIPQQQTEELVSQRKTVENTTQHQESEKIEINNHCNNESIDLEVEGDVDCGYFDEEMPSGTNDDEIEESDHLQHIREVYEFDEGTGDEIKDCLESEGEGDTESVIVLDKLLKWISPQSWSWQMTIQERWEIIAFLMDMDSFVLSQLAVILRKIEISSRLDFHRANIQAKSRVYEGKEVIGGTIVGCITRLEAVRATKPFAILIEEASEVMEPLLFACLGSSTQKLEMIGDHLQLQPSSMSKFDFERVNKINISMFERLICSPSSHFVSSTVLSMQRRMRKNICDLTRPFYTEITQIIDHPNCNVKRIAGSQTQNHLLQQCQSNGREVPGIAPHIFFWSHHGSQGKADVGVSRVNRTEATMVQHLVHYLVECGVPKPSIAVLTPYKGQLLLIRKLLMQDRNLSTKYETVALSTVDRFQGDEADIVIISLVTDAKSKTPFVKLINRMIVLLSRARIGMYLIGNSSYFESNPEPHWQKTFIQLNKPAVNDTDQSMVETFDGVQIGEEIPLCCPLHRESIKMAKIPSELKLNFCRIRCTATLPCSHECDTLCHYPRLSHKLNCKMQLDSPCQKHPRKLVCHQFNLLKTDAIMALQRYKCDVEDELQLPCTHVVRIPCWRIDAILKGDENWPKCSQPAFSPFIYPSCKHCMKCSCSQLDQYQKQPSSVGPCKKNTEFIPSCGHSINLCCSLKQRYEAKLSRFACPQQVEVILPRCEHLQKVPCVQAQMLKDWNGNVCADKVVREGVEYGKKDYTCKEKICFLRQCGHQLELVCEKAFEYARMPPPCTEKIEMVNPLCGHLVIVTCQEKQILDGIHPVQAAISKVEEIHLRAIFKPMPQEIKIKCLASVHLQATCGHEYSISCHEARNFNGVCSRIVQVKSPLCGHEINLPCHLQNIWEPWPSSFRSNPAYLQLMNDHILNDDITAPVHFEPPHVLKSYIRDCKEKIMLYRQTCGHTVLLNCEKAFCSVFKNSPIPCQETQNIKLPCGHFYEIACSSSCKDEVQCKKLIKRKCWNFLTCRQLVSSECCCDDLVACNKEISWKCDVGHSYNIQCNLGLPQDCPSCQIERVTLQLEEESHVDASVYFPKQLEHFKLLKKAAVHQRTYNQAKAQLFAFHLEWLQSQKTWERPLFEPRYIFCFKICGNEIDFQSKKFVKANDFNGIRLIQWGIGGLENLLKHMDNNSSSSTVKLLCGVGLTCRVFVMEKYISKKKRSRFISQKRKNGYDSIYIPDSFEFIFWEPFCLYSTHLLEISNEQIRGWIEILKIEDQTVVSFKPRKIEFLLPKKKLQPDSKTIGVLQELEDIFDRHQLTSNLFSVSRNWDGTSLTLHPLEENLVNEVVQKVSLKGSNSENKNPFACIKHLKKILCKSYEFHLLLALEFLHFGNSYLSDARQHIEQYVCQVQENQEDAHPLLLLALSRLLRWDSPTSCDVSKCLEVLTQLYPSATQWLEEKEVKKTPPPSNITDSIVQNWENLRNQGFESQSMEELLRMTGLKKVKQCFIEYFKTTVAFQKLSTKVQSKNLLTLNFAFVGNPGTGKTTVARLVAKVLRDSGVRRKHDIVETCAQKLKDMGSDEFRKLVAKAEGGVLFIDEAYDLDPANDLKGKEIVSELVTVAENKRESLSIIVAGYEDDMTKKFFGFNEGLQSRFETIVFEDFDENELLAIWQQLISERGFEDDGKMGRIISKRLSRQANKKGFGNARSVRQTFERALKKAINRPDFGGKTQLQCSDVMGEHPMQNNKVQQVLKQFDSKVGWSKIKQCSRDVVELSAKNYERELAGSPPFPFSLHRVFLGNPGTGKTTCAELYGRLLKELGLLSSGEVMLKSASDFIGQQVGGSQNKTCQILSSAKGKVLVIDEAYNLDDELYGKQVLDVLVEKIQGTPNDDMAVLLIGYETQMRNMMRNQNPGLARRFALDYAFQFEDYTDSELLQIFNMACRNEEVSTASFEVSERALAVLNRQRAAGNFGNAGAVKVLLQNAISKALNRQSSPNVCLIPEDIETGVNLEADPFAPLDKLYRIEKIRFTLERIKQQFQVAQQEGDMLPKVGHFVFRGAPGTGKTTVARVMANILFELEIIASNRLIETSGLDLTGEYLGQTKTKVTQKLGEAKGGVLLIDEAYELGKGQYGIEAMTTLLAAMTDPNYSLVIIIAGYPRDIEEMLNRNAGLKSRFTQFLDFEDWTPADALKCFQDNCQMEHFQLARNVDELLMKKLECIIPLPGWANGRDIAQLWEDTKKYRACRVIASPEDKKTIAFDDVEQALDDMRRARGQVSEKSMVHFDTVDDGDDIKLAKDSVCDVRKIKELVNQEEMDASQQESNDATILPTEERDDGVSDKDWQELETAKRLYVQKKKLLQQDEELSKSRRNELFEQQKIIMQKIESLKKERQEEEIKKELQKQKALKQQQEIERLKKEKIEAAIRKEKLIQERLRRLSPCPAGFRWLQVSGGWRCSAGGHFVSNEQLQAQFTI